MSWTEYLLYLSVTQHLIFDASAQAGGLVKEVANGGDGDTGKKSVADEKVRFSRRGFRFSISFKEIGQHKVILKFQAEDTDAEADQEKSREVTVDCEASKEDSTSCSEVENEEEYVLRKRKVVQEVNEE